jgi:hypothetical protein
MSVRQRLTFGKKAEYALKPRLEAFLNITLTPTVNQNDKVDYMTANGEYVELKSRPASRNFNTITPQDAKTYSAWLFPVCKTLNLNNTLHIFYWFESDDKLFYLQYDEEKFRNFRTTVPYRHAGNQLHYLIPAEEFLLVA